MVVEFLYIEYGVYNMKIGINEKYQIKEVNNITDESLTVIEFEEKIISEDGQIIDNPDFPFTGWEEETILKYCYEASGAYIKIYPYIKL